MGIVAATDQIGDKAKAYFIIAHAKEAGLRAVFALPRPSHPSVKYCAPVPILAQPFLDSKSSSYYQRVAYAMISY